MVICFSSTCREGDGSASMGDVSPMAARSFTITTALPEDLSRTLADVRSHVGSPTGGLVFVSGALTQQLQRVAEQVRAAWKGAAVCVVPAAGVLSERGEIEGASAASGVLWAGGRAAPFALTEPQRAEDPAGSSARSSSSDIKEALASTARAKSATALVFARPDAFNTDRLNELADIAPQLCIFGAGTVGGDAMMVSANGKLMSAPLGGLVVSGLAPPLVEFTPACRLLSPFEQIDEASGGMVLRVGGRSALDLLSSLTSELNQSGSETSQRGAAREPSSTAKGAGAGRGAARDPSSQPRSATPLVFAALAEEEPGADGRERYVVRPVRGIDPARGAVMIGREARAGVRFAFGVRDAGAARAGLEATARSVAGNALGSAARFAIYLSCAGRGQSLYGAPDVEARILRQRFGDLPIAGMHSSFELVPWGSGSARLALYTGVLALFRSPS